MNPDNLRVVGGGTWSSTWTELPHRLRSVVRDITTEALGWLYDDDPELEPYVDLLTVDEWRRLRDAGIVHCLDVPKPCRPGWMLIQFGTTDVRYLPPDVARADLHQAGLDTMSWAAWSLEVGCTRNALDDLAYACNALPDNPLPVLAVLALRRDLTDDQRWLHETLLGDATTCNVRQRLREALLDDFAPLARVVIADPALQARFELRGIE